MDCAAKALPGWPQGRMILIQSPEPSMCKDLQLRDRGSQGPPWKTARCQPYRGIRKLISWQVQEPQDILETSRKKEFAWNNLWWNTVGSWLPGLRTTNKTLSKVQPEILMGTSSKANSRGPTWWINTLTAHTETIRPNETSLVSWSRIIFQMNFIKSWETKGEKKKNNKKLWKLHCLLHILRSYQGLASHGAWVTLQLWKPLDMQTMPCPLAFSWAPPPPFRETGSASICNSIPLLHIHLLLWFFLELVITFDWFPRCSMNRGKILKHVLAFISVWQSYLTSPWRLSFNTC